MNLVSELENFDLQSAEVLYAKDSEIIKLKNSQVTQLISMSNQNERKRIRICTHRGPGELLHEMIIVHAKGTYVRPHKHLGRSESFHVISGRADVIVLDDFAEIVDVIPMGDYRSGEHFYYRLNSNFFHTMLIYSDSLVFQEVTMGPFDPKSTIFAPWSPTEDVADEVVSFTESMNKRAQNFLRL